MNVIQLVNVFCVFNDCDGFRRGIRYVELTEEEKVKGAM